MKNNKTIIVVPVLISIVTSMLIISLVFKIIKFSDEISNYYTPVILLSSNFMEATQHITKSLQTINPTHQSIEAPLGHFKSAYSEFYNFLNHPDRKFQTHVHEYDFIALAEQVVQLCEDNNFSQALDLLKDLKKESEKHLKKHEIELKEARRKIELTAYTIAGFCIFILFSGIILSFREYRVQKILRHQTTVTSAMTSLINALEARDKYTEGHSKRVVDYSAAVARELGLSMNDIKTLNLSALLHDIGKIGVPDHVLLKKDKLTDDEFEHIKKHPAAGAKMLDYENSMKKYLPGIIHHHERFDGKGYPDGLKGDEIPIIAQCIAIADAFDAMTSSRPYRTALSSDFAFKEIEKNRNKQWSDKVVTAFFKVVEKGKIIPDN
ncbi:MAG: HD-GYP domain-containing protein [Proteobacteria bacterium]|nr:HD-GYP domain-containing protein [Pseudomonadota bacterium]